MSHEVVDRVVKDCPKAATALGKGLEELVVAIKKSQEDGFQAGMDLPVIVMAAVHALVEPVKELHALPEEAKEDPMGLGQTLAISAFEIAKQFVPAKSLAAPSA